MASDDELLGLAQNAVDQDQYGQPIPPQGSGTLGLDLSAYGTPEQPSPVQPEPTQAVSALDNREQFTPPDAVSPNGPVSEGPTEMPGDRDMSTVAAPSAPGDPARPTVQDTSVTPEGAVRNLGTARDAALDAADAKAAEGPARSAQLEANAESQSELARQARDRAVEIQAEQQAQKDGIAAAQAKASSAMDEFKQFKFRDFWADKSGGERVLANISVALGAFNSDNTGGRNTNLDRINTLIDQQHRADVAQVHQKETFAKWMQEGVTDLASRYRDEMNTLKFKHAALSDAAAEEAKAQLIRNGIPVEEAENNTLVKGLRAKAQSEYAKGYSDEVKNKAQLAMQKAHLDISRAQLALAGRAQEDKAPSVAESDNAGRGRNMQLAVDQFEKSGLSDYVPSEKAQQQWFLNKERIDAAAENNKTVQGQLLNAAQRKLGLIPENDLKGLSKKDAMYFATFGRMVEPYARKQSGSAISAPEWKSFSGHLGIGQAGGAGRELREQIARDMLTLGGRATKMLESSDAARGRVSPGKAAPTGHTAQAVVPDGATGTAKDGTPVVRQGGKWVAAGK
jgi:hypothetical protein